MTYCMPTRLLGLTGCFSQALTCLLLQKRQAVIYFTALVSALSVPNSPKVERGERDQSKSNSSKDSKLLLGLYVSLLLLISD